MSGTIINAFKPLVTRCIALTLFFCSLIVAAKTVGGRLPSVKGGVEAYFQSCVLPCFDGITLGSTSAQAARAALARLTDSHGSARALNVSQWVYSTNLVQISLSAERGTDTEYATRLDIDSIQQPALIRLGDVLLQLGAPHCSARLPAAQPGQSELILEYTVGRIGLYFLFRIVDAPTPQLHADAVRIYPLADTQTGAVSLLPANLCQIWHGLRTR